MGAFRHYAQFEGLWAAFAPQTPFGRDHKARMVLHTVAAELEAIWDHTDLALAFLEELAREPVRLDRVSHHLKRLPRFPEGEPSPYGEVELFQFKKFLHNYRCLHDLLSPALREAFGFTAPLEVLFQLLDTGRQSAEAFQVADEYGAELRAVRAQMRETDEALGADRARRAAAIQERWGLAFGAREFLVAPRATLGDLAAAAALLRVEPFDDAQCLVRPLPSATELLLAQEREALSARERLLEDQVLATLSQAVGGELDRLREHRRAVTAFDLAMARARLAREHRLTRPLLGPGPIQVAGGRFLPCQEACAATDTPYVPLDATFDTSVTVVFGSNMGGKTVVLKTLAFLQLCVQSGLFAPAERFHTRVFRHCHYVGEGAEVPQGLSGFAAEISRFNEVWADLGEPTLALFDEFARTTQSREAEALLSAAMAALSARPGLVALFSTHFRGIRRFEAVRYFRMKGLVRQAIPADPAHRIRSINRCMDFRLEPDDGSLKPSDAITVAALLGLDPDIAEQAGLFFKQGM